MFFNKPWSEVSDIEISNLSEKLESELGGWIFHRKVNFEEKTPWMYVEAKEPEIMEGYFQ